MESIRAFLDATGAFLESLADVRLEPLLLAVGLHVLNLTLRTRGWLNIIRAAYPEAVVRWRGVLGAYFAGVGINAFAPARAGDVVKLYAVRQRVEGSTAPTLVATLIAETTFDFFVASGLMLWAYSTGGLPSLPEIPSAPAFEWSFVARHTRLVEVVLVVMLFALAILFRWLTHRVRAFWRRVRQGLTILRTPRRFLRQVVLFQALGWVARIGTAYFMLEAFRVHATITNALLVMVVNSISTLLPFTPGGAGAQQALLVIVLSGAAADSTLLAYSVGNQAVITAANVLLGLGSMYFMFRGLSWRKIARRAETARVEAVEPVPPA